MFDGEAGTGAGEGDAKADAETKNEKQDETKDDDAEIEGLGDKGKAALKAERDAKKAALADAKTAKEERDALKAEKAEREAAEQQAKDDAAKESGKWEELATKREGELKSAKDEAATLKAQNDQYKAAMADGLEARLKELPEKLRKLLEDAVPEDDTLGRWTWLHKPTFQELVKEATDKADPKRGNGVDPKSRGDGKGNDEAARKSQAVLYRNF